MIRHPQVLSLAGLACAACGGGGGGGFQTPPPQGLPIDLVTSAVDGTITLGGATPPTSAYENARIYLVPDGGIGARAVVGQTMDGGYQDVHVLAGTYGAEYERIAGGQIIPANEGMPLAASADLSSDATFDIDVPVATLSVTFTLDGAAFPGSAYESAVFSFRPVGGGDEVPFGRSENGVASVSLVPGTYDFFYSLDAGGAIVPVNRHALVRAGQTVVGTTNIAINVVSIQTRFLGRLDGADFPASADQSGLWEWSVPATGDSLVIGASDSGEILRRVIPGTYDVVYSHVAGASVPANVAAVVATGVVVDAGHPIVHVDLHSALLSPSYTHDGGPFLPSQGADFLLRGTSPGDTFLLGATSQPVPDDVRVVEGDYDVLYAYQFGAGIPKNSRALVEAAHTVAGDQALAVSIWTVPVTPTFRHNGHPFPASASESAAFLLHGQEAGDVILFGFSNAPPEPVLVAPGTYDLYYQHSFGASIPSNPSHRLMQGLSLAAPQGLLVSVASRYLLPAFTIDGQPPPSSAYESGSLSLREEDGSLFLLGRTHLVPAPIRIISGNYDVVYELEAGGSVLPRNRSTTVTTIAVN